MKEPEFLKNWQPNLSKGMGRSGKGNGAKGQDGAVARFKRKCRTQRVTFKTSGDSENRGLLGKYAWFQMCASYPTEQGFIRKSRQGCCGDHPSRKKTFVWDFVRIPWNFAGRRKKAHGEETQWKAIKR